jgi:hypothetical protein
VVRVASQVPLEGNLHSEGSGDTFELREHPKARFYQLTGETQVGAHANYMRYGKKGLRYLQPERAGNDGQSAAKP